MIGREHRCRHWAPLATGVAREAPQISRPQLGDRVTARWNELAANRDDLGTVFDALAAPEEIVGLLITYAETVEAEVYGPLLQRPPEDLRP